MVYELRIYTVQVGRLRDVIDIYQRLGWPVIEPRQDRLVGYFVSDVGPMNQLVHLWRFADDAERRAFWNALYAEPAFQAFARELRPCLVAQENRLLANAPWGPTP